MTLNSKSEIGFLIYDSRSGSTLLASLLNAHPEIFVSLEAEYLLSAMKYRRKTGAFPIGEKLRGMLESDNRLSEWNIDFLKLFDKVSSVNEHATLKIYTEALMNEAARDKAAEGKTEPDILILKQGLLTGYLDELNEIWPNAYLIHIYRDGRAVFASKKRSINIDLKKPMSDDPVSSAHRWMRIQKKVQSIAGKLPLIDICYEKLIENNEKILDSLWCFLSVNPLILNPDSMKNYARRIPNSQKQIHTLVGKPPDPKRINAWQTNLSLIEIWKYERVAKEMLKQRGYDTVFSGFKGFVSLIRHRYGK